jgi:diguanylate cyclase (GGDEF)-like protein
MVDLDNFKRVNDTFGHGAGDEVLISVAKILQGQLRQSDSLARYGGEEFVILLPETDLQSAALLAKRLQQSLADQIITYEAHRIQVRASFGLTSINDAVGLSLESFYRLADMALYTAKGTGGNRVSIYDPDKDSPANEPSASIVQLKID